MMIENTIRNHTLLMRKRTPLMLAVPVEEPDRTMFNDLLGGWYMRDDPMVVGWLAEWNRNHPDDNN